MKKIVYKVYVQNPAGTSNEPLVGKIVMDSGDSVVLIFLNDEISRILMKPKLEYITPSVMMFSGVEYENMGTRKQKLIWQEWLCEFDRVEDDVLES